MNLTHPMFSDEDTAREYLEKQRWPNGPVCPHCRATSEQVTPIKGARAQPSKAHPEGVERKGLYQCNHCRQQFTITVKTIFERSKIPLNKWLAATYMVTSSKKGISAHQIHRTLGVTYKTAWFMLHRIREAMVEDTSSSGPLGGEGKIVEADETYIGTRDVKPTVRKDGTPFRADAPGALPKQRGRRGSVDKRVVVALVERGGAVRSFHVRIANRDQVRDILVRNASRQSKLFTDESRIYTVPGREFAEHDTVNHFRKEYVRGEVHTNTIENVFSVFKRGMIGIYQHCGEAHLHRYLREFDFRYNRRTALGWNDRDRHISLLQATGGKRLTYRRIGETSLA